MRWAVLALLLLAAGSAGAASLQAKDDGNNPRYEPFELTVAPGEQVTLTDAGAEPHTMTNADAAWPAISVEPGNSSSFAAPMQVGDYKFYCAYHASPATQPGQGMAGILHVKAGGAPPATGPAGPTKSTPDLGPLGLTAGLALALLLRRP